MYNRRQTISYLQNKIRELEQKTRWFEQQAEHMEQEARRMAAAAIDWGVSPEETLRAFQVAPKKTQRKLSRYIDSLYINP